MTTRQPIAVIISDIHFTPATLDLASESLRLAMQEAIDLRVPLVISGDTLDSKAIIRGECANRLIRILSDLSDGLHIYMLVGNHDLLNEKGTEHSLNFLKPYVRVIQSPLYVEALQTWMIPYQTSPEAMQTILDGIPKGSRLIIHQGVQTAFMGHYVQDKTSLPIEAYADFRVISGHYHRAQNIKCGRPRKGAVGLFSYIGNPYSLNFGEANDGPKGFQVLYDDGLLIQVPTNLRKHVVLDLNFQDLDTYEHSSDKPTTGDLIWLKLTGPASELAKIKKVDLGNRLFGHANFKLDKIPLEAKVETTEPKNNQTGAEMLDKLIDDMNETPTQVTTLKSLWRELLS